MKYVDLHAHTVYSDGNMSPAGIFDMAVRANLSALAITDHDRVDGLAYGPELSEKTGVEFVPGVELTSDWDGHEAHILAYYPNLSSKALKSYMNAALEARERMSEQIIEMLNKRGEPVDLEDLQEARASHKPELGGFPLINLLLRKNLVSDVNDFFRRILAPEGIIGNIKAVYPDVHQAIDTALDADAVPILAHPCGYRGGICERKIAYLKKLGIAGLEAWSSYHSEAERIWVTNTARNLGLIVTGGSDCHGDERAVVLRPLGSTGAPYSCLEELKSIKYRQN